MPRRFITLCVGILMLVLLKAAWGAPPEAQPPTEVVLAGTAWQLVGIQSMDDSQGSQTIPAGETYTLRFAADGRASFRLHCNRGMAAWTAAPAGDGSGSLSFGMMAATRAYCPPPSISDKVQRDLGQVGSYRIIRDRLFLSLLADGVIYEWIALPE